MGGDFQTVVAKLWAALGLQRPQFAADGSCYLTVDGLKITLSSGIGGRSIIVSGQAGEVSGNPAVRADQISRVLKSSLRNLPVTPACVCLDRNSSHEPAIVVRAISPCSAALMERL